MVCSPKARGFQGFSLDGGDIASLPALHDGMTLVLIDHHPMLIPVVASDALVGADECVPFVKSMVPKDCEHLFQPMLACRVAEACTEVIKGCTPKRARKHRDTAVRCALMSSIATGNAYFGRGARHTHQERHASARHGRTSGVAQRPFHSGHVQCNSPHDGGGLMTTTVCLAAGEYDEGSECGYSLYRTGAPTEAALTQMLLDERGDGIVADFSVDKCEASEGSKVFGELDLEHSRLVMADENGNCADVCALSVGG
ncbi:hypothetical protein J2X36_004545 [Methylobacterium sp. BE186]|uniref:hypothetical protein n=1 Tax=Methylobacterium sp. BE186 TaxID=2817715 RepID=UPI0028571477|nr:hypothetical protein [Methylobacterium sp. BE186]MDR7039767.1 hypothetical protein [Methylobacterium sp. BE186]